jgi:hypothetical protein
VGRLKTYAAITKDLEGVKLTNAELDGLIKDYRRERRHKETAE